MLFPTVPFAVFFVVALTANWLLRPAFRVWLVAMSAMSLYFYGYSESARPFVLLLVGSAAGNWVLGQAVHAALGPDGSRTDRSLWLVRLAVFANLGVLAWFKYYDFARVSLGLPLPAKEIVLPVAISFFTFHAISYVIDIGRGDIRPMPAGDFVLYLSFFPHLVAGPIVRAREFAPQIRRRPDPRSIPAAEAFRLILFGLFKKVVISSYVATELVDPVFGAPGAHGRLELLVGVYAYAIQIYADFSGYTDIAIGCALLLGFRFPQNFDAPYRALSLQDFWRRWHMTLSRWLRDYLYIPLGGNRASGPLRACYWVGRLVTRRPARPLDERDLRRGTYLNLGLTMVLGGLWHGAAWTFVVWGAIHGGFLAIERLVRERWAAAHPVPVLAPGLSAALRWFLTFHVVCLAWIFFRADSLGTAFDVLGGIATSTRPSPLVTVLLLVTIVLALASQFVPPRLVTEAQVRFTEFAPAAQAVALALALTAIDVLGPDGVAPFIYFQF